MDGDGIEMHTISHISDNHGGGCSPFGCGLVLLYGESDDIIIVIYQIGSKHARRIDLGSYTVHRIIYTNERNGYGLLPIVDIIFHLLENELRVARAHLGHSEITDVLGLVALGGYDGYMSCAAGYKRIHISINKDRLSNIIITYTHPL